jgi:hypothetical protein
VLTFFIFGLIYVKRKHKRIRILTWIHGVPSPKLNVNIVVRSCDDGALIGVDDG